MNDPCFICDQEPEDPREWPEDENVPVLVCRGCRDEFLLPEN